MHMPRSMKLNTSVARKRRSTNTILHSIDSLGDICAPPIYDDCRSDMLPFPGEGNPGKYLPLKVTSKSET